MSLCLQVGRTALILALIKGHTNVVQLLLAAGANIHIADTVSICLIYYCTITM